MQAFASKFTYFPSPLISRFRARSTLPGAKSIIDL